MSQFEVKVVSVDAIEEHPNADAIEIAVIGGFRSIVRKDQEMLAGDLVVYIPEASLVPQWLLEEMGMWDTEKDKGRLVGKKGDRVKAIKLRGVVSQGLIFPLDKWSQSATGWSLIRGVNDAGERKWDYERIDAKAGDEVSEWLGITKYEPPIPTQMQGQVCGQPGLTVKFDIESIQKHPNIIKEGEEVIMTEKVHGTWACFGCVPHLDDERLYDGEAIISSKGLSERGLAFKWVDENRERNLYVRTFEQIMLDETMALDVIIDEDDEAKNTVEHATRWDVLSLWARQFGMPYYILGEIFGPGVQGDFDYGFKDKQFRVFDIYAGTPGQGRFLGYHDLMTCTTVLRLPMVPLLSWGPFVMNTADRLRDGSPVEGGAHVREGIVIKPVHERQDEMLGRVCLKYVSPDYLLRGGNATEYN